MSAATENSTIRPFQIEISEEQLVDLRKRVSATKFPERETVTDQSQGVQLATIQKLARYWATEYDWRCRLGTAATLFGRSSRRIQTPP